MAHIHLVTSVESCKYCLLLWDGKYDILEVLQQHSINAKNLQVVFVKDKMGF